MLGGASLVALLATVFFLLPYHLAASGTNEVGIQFLEDNKNRPGVVALPSGLQYKVLRKGGGEVHATIETNCRMHLACTTPSLTPDAIGKEPEDWDSFENTYKSNAPAAFAPKYVMKGWAEAMQLMVEKDVLEVYTPSELAYGDKGHDSKVKGGEVLICRMEMESIKAWKDTNQGLACDVATLQGCTDRQTTYLEKQRLASAEKRKGELERLRGMQEGNMKPETKSWVLTRIWMLEKMAEKDEL